RIVAAPAAHFAGDENVGQEVHLDAPLPLSPAGLAAPALDVEAEAAGPVASLARFGQHGVELADGREEAGVSGGIRARRAADGRLIDDDDLVDVLRPRDGAVRARLLDSAIELFRQGAVEDVADQGGFPRTRDAGHDGQDAQRELGVHVLQVVLARAQDGEELSVGRATRRRHGDRQASGEVLAGERLVRLSHLLWSPRGYEISAVAAGARAEVDHVVGAPDSLLVVL